MKVRDVIAAAFGRSVMGGFRGAKLALAFAVLASVVIPAAAVGDSLPTVSGEAVSEVGVTTAKLSGAVNPHGSAGAGNTSWKFELSPITEEAWATVAEGTIEPPASEEGNSVPVEAIVGYGGELRPGHEYEFRLVAENGAGRVETASPYPTFTMDEATVPTLTIAAPSNIGPHSAHLSGTVDPEGGNTNPIGPEIFPIYWELQYSEDGTNWATAQSVGSNEISGSAAQGTSPITVEADATGLIAGKTYQVRLRTSSTNYSSFNVEATSPGPNPSFETGVTAPTVTEQEVGAFNPVGGTATLAGLVNPENTDVTDCHFVYGIGSASGNEAPCSPTNVATSEEQRVGITAETGQFKLTFEGQTTENIPANPSPEVLRAALEALSTIGFGNVEVTEAPLNSLFVESSAYKITFLGPLAGKDVPQLEWSQGTNPLHSVKAEEAEASNGYEIPSASVETLHTGNLHEAVRVTATVSGLARGTEYRYKVVASNAYGTNEGPVNWFKTTPVPAPEGPCPNEARRAEQHSVAAECRAYEMASPVDKSGIGISSKGVGAISAVDGSAVAYRSRGEFAGSVGSSWNGTIQYAAFRGPDGWTTHPISPLPGRHVPTVPIASTYAFMFSSDIRHALLWAYDLPGVENDLPERQNFYREDLETGALEVLTPASQLIGPAFFVEWLNKEWGGASSADLGVSTFTATNDVFDPRAVSGTPNAYEWDHGTVRLAGLLPGESAPPAGGSRSIEVSVGGRISPSVSSDGSRLLFYSPANGNRQLYMRRNHTETVWVSEPEFSGAPEAENLELLWASEDLHKIIFRSDSPLVDEGPGTKTGGIFLYTDGPHPASESNLKLIAGSEEFGCCGYPIQVAAVSDNAERIYFSGSKGPYQLLLWENGKIRNVEADLSSRQPRADDSPENIRASADGSVVAYFTGAPFAGEGLLEVYDALRNTKSCISCGSTYKGSREASILPKGDLGAVGIVDPRVQPRFVSADGRRVFFSTPEAFVPEDTNGVEDVYVYDTLTGERHLVSSGKGEQDAWFADASASGSDVFMLTAGQLVGTDRDNLIDLYDARVGGGFPEPPPPPTSCSGDNCRGPLSSPLEGQSPATSSFSGPGNPHPKPHRKHHRRKHKGHKHKGKKGHGHHRHHRAGGHR